eukprot:2850210-Rhodomonas_salina.2
MYECTSRSNSDAPTEWWQGLVLNFSTSRMRLLRIPVQGVADSLRTQAHFQLLTPEDAGELGAHKRAGWQWC